MLSSSAQVWVGGPAPDGALARRWTGPPVTATLFNCVAVGGKAKVCGVLRVRNPPRISLIHHPNVNAPLRAADEGQARSIACQGETARHVRNVHCLDEAE